MSGPVTPVDAPRRSCEEVGTAYDEWAAGGDRFGWVASPLSPVGVAPPAWPRG